MALSDSHIRLVGELKSYVFTKYGSAGQLIIYTDNPDPNIKAKTPIIGGTIPDLYARCFCPEVIIIGEAKTVRDVESRHSIAQYEQYLRYCSHSLNIELIFAVPWTALVTLKNKIRVIKRRLNIYDVKPIYIEPLPE